MNIVHVNSSGRGDYQAQRVKKQNSPLLIQCRVLHALILRELKARYGDRHLGFLWAVIEPLIFMSIFVLGFYLLGRDSQSGVPAPLFFVAGFVPFFMFRDIYSEIVGGTKGHQSLLMFPQVTRMDILISKMIVNSAISVCVFLVLTIGLLAMGLDFTLDNPLGVMIGFGLMIMLGFGTGLVLGALSIRYQFVSSLSSPLLGRPLFLTSGLFFSCLLYTSPSPRD